MLGLEHIAQFRAPLVPISELMPSGETDGSSLDAIRANGLVAVPVAAGQTTVDLARRVTSDAIEARADLAGHLAGAILAHSLPAPAPPGHDLAADWLDPLGLGRLEALVLSGQPCAILYNALRAAAEWLDDLLPGATLLVVGADAANSPDERIFFNSAMGDAAVACLLTRQASRNFVRSIHVETHVIAAAGELSDSSDIARFRQMNPFAIRDVIGTAIGMAGLTLTDISSICPHTPQTPIWDVVAKLLDFPRERILTDYIVETGHLNSNDALLHYARACDEGRLEEGDNVVLVNPGFGGTRGCAILTV